MPKFQFSGGGGILYSDLDSDNFHLGGILYSDLDSLTIFVFGGVLRLGLSDNFHFRGGGEGEGGILQNRGKL